MKSMEPIRDKKVRCDEVNFGFRKIRNLVLFSIGINTEYRISDLIQIKLSDVLEISRGRVIVKERLSMKVHKNGQIKFSLHFEQITKSDSRLCSI